MPIVTVRPPAGRAGPTDDFSRGIAEGVFEALVDEGIVEAAVSVGTVVAEVVFIAEFAVGDAFFVEGGGLDRGVDTLI